jgi:hypothetical protein
MPSAIETIDENTGEPRSNLVHLGLVVFLVLSFLLTGWLLVRRTSGALTTLSEIQVLCGGLLAVLVDGLWREARRRAVHRAPSLAERWLPTIVLCAALFTIGSQTGPWISLSCLAVLALIGEWSWHRYVEPLSAAPAVPPASAVESPVRTSENAAEVEGPRLYDSAHTELDELPAPEVEQQWVRSRNEQGREQIWAVLRVHFASDQRIEIAHVAFCPVLEDQFEIEAYVIDGPVATVRVTSAKPHGARIEVRLAQPAQQQEVVTLEVVIGG